MGFFHQSICFTYFCVSLYLNHFSSNANPIIGDAVRRAGDTEFPSVVSLGIVPAKNESDHFCTGTLISKKHVVTCAHCVGVGGQLFQSWNTPTNVLVTVGSTDMTQGTKHEVADWKIFDQWIVENNYSVMGRQNLYHDIAVVTLKKDVENIKPARLSKLRYQDIVGKTAVAAGWGQKTISGEKSRFLRRADLRVIKNELCVINLVALNYPPYYDRNHFCTIGETKPTMLSCGDSGGPIFMNGDELVGVNDATCGQHGYPNQQNLHLPVKIYRKFIKAVVNPSLRNIENGTYNIDKFYQFLSIS